MVYLRADFVLSFAHMLSIYSLSYLRHETLDVRHTNPVILKFIGCALAFLQVSLVANHLELVLIEFEIFFAMTTKG